MAVVGTCASTIIGDDVSAAIGREVRRVKVRNPDLLPDVVGKKQPRLDINCEFDGGRRADIELRLPLREANDFLLRRKSRKAVCFATRARRKP